jgi:MFS family permease
MDTLGAAIGPLVAFGMLAMWPGDFRRVFFASAIPAAIAIAVLVLFVHAPRHVASLRSLAQARASLPPAFWRFCIADGAFQLANSSMAFVLLRARDAGIPAASVPLAYAGYNVVYAAAAYPAGQLADRFGRRPLLFAAYGLYAGTYALLAFAHGAPALVAVFALLGIQSALLEVSQRALVSDLAGAEGRATAFGIYYTVAGLALLPASIIAGALWDRFGAEVTFTVDAALALLAALLLLALLPLRGAAQERLDAAR